MNFSGWWLTKRATSKPGAQAQFSPQPPVLMDKRVPQRTANFCTGHSQEIGKRISSPMESMDFRKIDNSWYLWMLIPNIWIDMVFQVLIYPHLSAQMYAIFNRCLLFLPERYPSTSFNIRMKKMDGRPWHQGIIAGAILGLLANSNTIFLGKIWSTTNMSPCVVNMFTSCLPVVYQLFTICLPSVYQLWLTCLLVTDCSRMP